MRPRALPFHSSTRCCTVNRPARHSCSPEARVQKIGKLLADGVKGGSPSSGLRCVRDWATCVSSEGWLVSFCAASLLEGDSSMLLHQTRSRSEAWRVKSPPCWRRAFLQYYGTARQLRSSVVDPRVSFCLEGRLEGSPWHRSASKGPVFSLSSSIRVSALPGRTELPMGRDGIQYPKTSILRYRR